MSGASVKNGSGLQKLGRDVGECAPLICRFLEALWLEKIYSRLHGGFLVGITDRSRGSTRKLD